MPATPDKRDSLEYRRKRLRYRCWHRGTKELDLLLGSFADRHVSTFDGSQLDTLEGLLQVPEPVLHAWLVGGDAPPPEFESDTLRLLLAHRPDVSGR